LEALHRPIPTPTQAAIAQNKAEEESRRTTGMMSHVMGSFKKHPDVAKATKVGDPPLVDPKGMSATDFSKEVTQALMPPAPTGGKTGLAVEIPKDGSPAPPPNEPAPRSDSIAPAVAPSDGSAAAAAPDPNELKPTAPPDANELKVDPEAAGPTAPPPTQVNEIQPGTAAAASASSSSSSTDTSSGKASTSKKKKKKGLGKLNPF
jgi:outer membrane protein assembly factor BamD